MNKLFLFVVGIYFITPHDAASLVKRDPKITLRGRIVFPGGSQIPIEADGKLTVELQDTSLADAPARVISRGVGKAIRFPMAFAIKYSAKQILEGHTYSLHATIRNKQGELLYINDMFMGVTPTGVSRTTTIDVPVILVKQAPPADGKTQWPELVGKDGDYAVKIIKQETGFEDVATIKEGSPITLDYRMDRVRVFINDKGVVSSIPTVG